MKRAALALALVALAAAPAAAGSYRWPTTYGVGVTAGYDNNGGSGSPLDWQCGGNTYSGHRGTDIGVGRNTAVYAGAPGWVKRSMDGFGDGYLGSTDGGGFGNHVAIYHGDGDETIYAHLTAGTGLPGEGATLACSDFVGGSGNSGSSTGPHLHFETRVGVSETGSYYSGSADDPYAGPCSGPLSYWTNQNGGTPTTDCWAAPPPPDPCAGLTAQGECQGDLLRWCEGGAIQQRDCAAEGLVCAWQDDAAGNRCLPMPDGDGDGAPVNVDCDDGDAEVYPGATESCDGVDSDCSGAADEGLVRTCGCGLGLQACVEGAWGACDETCPDGEVDPTDPPAPGEPGVSGGCGVAAKRGPGGGWGGGAILLVLAGAAGRRRRREPRR